MNGTDQKPIVIGMVLEDIFADFSKELIENVMNAIPEKRNIRLVVLPGRYYNPEYHPNLSSEDVCEYNEVYNSIFRLGEQCNFDGFIVHIGNLSSDRRNTVDDSLMANFRNVPSIFIATDIKDVAHVVYDNEKGIREAIDYLVKINGFSRICMLGGRADNMDSMLRKEIFIRCLESNGIHYTEDLFINTDMSVNCTEEAEVLLDRNPLVQAVFCVNDASAKGLYTVMEKRGLVPGQDILVFGFDNTHMASEMIPPLSSIGCDGSTLGQKALELLLSKLNGFEVSSALVPTRLYGRESFRYEMYDYTTAEMKKNDSAFINRMFDDCFYRYRNKVFRRGDVDLRRLFYEFISRILNAHKRRYVSKETYQALCKMIDRFFDQGAMAYTDAGKLIHSINHLQVGINSEKSSIAANLMINRLFSRMRDRAVIAVSEQNIRDLSQVSESQSMLQDYLISCMIHAKTAPDPSLRSLNKLGLHNAAIYVFDESVMYSRHQHNAFPKRLRLYCVIKSGDLYILAKERQQCLLADIFIRNELPVKCKSYAAFPIFYSERIYGIMLCELTGDIFTRGEFLSMQIGRSFYISDLQREIKRPKQE